jgi:hypothetical protein
MSSSKKSVIVVGEGYAFRSTLSSVVSRHAGSVDVVAGVPDPNQCMPMAGAIAVKADLWDKASLTATLKERSYARLFLVLPGHADRLKIGWNCLEAARNAGILQVVVVSVLTAETHNDLEGHFRPLQDNIEGLGRVSVQEDQQVEHSGSSSSSVPPLLRGQPLIQRGDSGVLSKSANAVLKVTPSGPVSDTTDPSKCLRIQRKNCIQGWFPVKVKLVQFSLPNLKLKSRGRNPGKRQGDNGLAHLERTLCGPFRQACVPAGLGNDLVNKAMLMSQKQPVWQQNYLDPLQQFQTAAIPNKGMVPTVGSIVPTAGRPPPDLLFAPQPTQPPHPPLESFSVAFLRELEKRNQAMAGHHQQKYGWF